MTLESSYNKPQITGIVLGTALFFFLIIFPLSPDNIIASRMAAVAVLMSALWITEAIPLGATALLPVFLYPILGILSAKQTAPIYFNSIILLFLGGFSIAVAMEKWDLHKRISLIIIRAIGSSPRKLILGFMLACAVLSMFISNTATALMMLPIALAVIYKLEEDYSRDKVKKFSIALLLGIAYASSIGGEATLVGTPPNLAFLRIYQISFPEAPEISFGQWMAAVLPISIVMLAIAWFMLTAVIFKIKNDIKINRSVVHKEYKQMGGASFEEKLVFVIFILTALLWIFRKDIDIGAFQIPGWADWFSFGELIDDGTVAIFTAFFLFVLPTRSGRRGRILTANDIKKIPWEIILLFGGGFALAAGFQSSGLSEVVGREFQSLAGAPTLLLVGAASTTLTFLTELTSNTATTQTLLPIFASIATAIKVNPLYLMIPATISASFAFMLPVATPPNAIIFGSGRIKVSDMARAGIFINIIGIIVNSLIFYFWGGVVFQLDPSIFPGWAN